MSRSGLHNFFLNLKEGEAWPSFMVAPVGAFDKREWLALCYDVMMYGVYGLYHF